MKSKQKSLLAIGLLVLNTLLFKAESFCIERTLKEQFKISNVVFQGKAVGIKPLAGRNGYYITTFEIEKAWKGIKNNSRIDIVTFNFSDEGHSFEIGKTYLVLDSPEAAKSEKINGLVTMNCTHTGLIDSNHAQADVKQLGKPQLVIKKDIK